MRENLEIIERIDNYLIGNMSQEEKNRFEAELTKNDSLKSQVENQKLVLQAINRKGLKADIIKASGTGSYNVFWIIGSLIVLIAIASFFLINTSQIESVADLNIKEEVKGHLTFNGLKTWVAPDVQYFTVDASKGATIEGKDGILIIIPANAFLDTNGQVVKGDVDFELIEAFTLEDMVLYNLTTLADGNALETGGMFYTNATLKGNKLVVNPKRPLYIEIPTDKSKDGMMAFKGEINQEGNINWKDPIELKKFLVRIDFKELDFIPTGFEQKVNEGGRNSKFYLHSKEQIDSLYYTLAYQEVNDTISLRSYDLESVLSLAFGQRIADSITVDESPVELDTLPSTSCGIDPLTVQTIKSSKFQNTFIATQEFEERIKVLHQIDNGEKLIQIYINNLAKNMWEADSMVASNLSGNNRKIFKSFAAQKLTNLKDANIYQEQLSKYYNRKKEANRKALIKVKNDLELADQIRMNKMLNELAQIRNKAAMEYAQMKNPSISNSVVNTLPLPSVATSNAYSTQWASFGWANIDRYLKYLDKQSKEVDIIVNNTLPDLKIYQWLNLINTLTPIITDGNKGMSVFPSENNKGSKSMKNTYAIAISRKGNQFRWASLRYNPYERDLVTLNLTPISMSGLKDSLRLFDSSTSPLVKRIKTAEELIKEALNEKKMRDKIFAQQMKEATKREAFIQKQTGKMQKEIEKEREAIKERQMFIWGLKKVCFPCEIPNPALQLQESVNVFPESDF